MFTILGRMADLLPVERVAQHIYLIRSQRVMLSADLSHLYGVLPKVLVQAVKRNKKRFPDDFMFQLSPEEFKNLKSQFVTSSWGGMRRALPYAFTDYGVAMLSAVLRTPQAIGVSIVIMRVFVKLREVLATHKELSRKLYELEHKVGHHDEQIRAIFEAIKEIMAIPEKPRNPVGFKLGTL